METSFSQELKAVLECTAALVSEQRSPADYDSHEHTETHSLAQLLQRRLDAAADKVAPLQGSSLAACDSLAREVMREVGCLESGNNDDTCPCSAADDTPSCAGPCLQQERLSHRRTTLRDRSVSLSLRHATICLRCLQAIQACTAAASAAVQADKEQPLLGMADQRRVKSLIEAVIGFGFAPRLLSGFNMPLAGRVKANTSRQLEDFLDGDVSAGEVQKTQELEELLQLCIGILLQKDASTVASIIEDVLLPDMLRAYVQSAFLHQFKGSCEYASEADDEDLEQQFKSFSLPDDDIDEPTSEPLKAVQRLMLSIAPSRALATCFAAGSAAQSVPTHRVSAPSTEARVEEIDEAEDSMLRLTNCRQRFLRLVVSALISQTISRLDGVAALLRIIVHDEAEHDLQHGWRSCQRAATLISAPAPALPPAAAVSYLEKVSSQLVQLIQQPPTEAFALHQRAAVMAMLHTLRRQPTEARPLVFDPVFRPLILPDLSQFAYAKDSIIFSEEDVDNALQTARLVFILHGQSTTSMRPLSWILGQLTQLYFFSSRSKSHQQSLVRELITLFYTLAPVPACGAELVACMEAQDRLLLKSLRNQHRQAQSRTNALCDDDQSELTAAAVLMPQFVLGPTGGAELRAQALPEDGVDSSMNQHEASQLVALLAGIERTGLHASLFLALLEYYASVESDVSRHTKSNSKQSSDGTPSSVKQPPAPEEAKSSCVAVLRLVLAMVEECGPEIVSDVAQGLRCIKVMLQLANPDLLMLSLSLLDTMLSGIVPIDRKCWPLLDDLVPHLESLETHRSKHVTQMAFDCKASITTRDGRWSKAGSMQPDPGNVSKEFDEALQHVRDELLPVRAHGLIQLRRLILRKSPDALRNVPYVLGIFTSCLADHDSYLYLAAINGLAALGDILPTKIIPSLTAEFRDLSRPVETRMKIGEALVLVARRCGEALPKYLDLLLPAVFQGTRDDDATMRASALSNLAYIVELLKFSLHKCIGEVMECVEAIATTDKEPEARRGAINVITLMMRGLGQSAIQVVGDQLPRLLRLLRQVEEKDEDEVVKVHARMALGQLEDLARRYTAPLRSKHAIVEL